MTIRPDSARKADERPHVLPAIERLIVRAAEEVHLLATLTPVEAERERARLTADLLAGRTPLPRWTYARVAHVELQRALDEAERLLAGSRQPYEEMVRARARELWIEAALSAAAGTSGVDRLARLRFAEPDPAIARAASDLCATWLAEPAAPRAGPLLPSDDPDPRSLLSQMRAAVGNLHLPFAVVAQRSLAPLAATGDRVILVASGRLVAEEDATRTVLHEVEGHVCPRARASCSPFAIVRVGTAGGVDDQEGRALLLEARAGMLGPRRRRQLAARHRAVEAMLDGASFADVAFTLVRQHGLDPCDAVVVAERAFRGGDGSRPGLGRERIYLESFVRVRGHLGMYPADEEVMKCGQVAVDAIAQVRELIATA